MIFFLTGVFMMFSISYEWWPESELQGMLGYILCAIWMLIGAIQMKIDVLIETIKNKV
jgi:hypothetical protein